MASDAGTSSDNTRSRAESKHVDEKDEQGDDDHGSTSTSTSSDSTKPLSDEYCDQLVKHFEELYENRYTDDDQVYVDNLKRTVDAPPVISPWYGKARRNFDYDKTQQRPHHHHHHHHHHHRDHHRDHQSDRGSRFWQGQHHNKGDRDRHRYQPYHNRRGHNNNNR